MNLASNALTFSGTLSQFSVNNLQVNQNWSFNDLGRSETTYLTHSYHRYPAKFIPQIVRKLIDDYAPERTQVVCDPFGGCGTTLVEAKLSGHASIGFDINPIAKLITQTKITPIKPRTLANCRAKLFQYYEKAPDVSYKHQPKIDYWFDSNIVKELDKIYYAIRKIKNRNARRFFLCAFSHNLKNCSRWLMKSIKPTIDKDKIFPSPKDCFFRHLDSMIKKNEKFFDSLVQSGFNTVPTKMYRRDSTKKLPIASNSVDLIITSPPYVTSYEYADLHQLSLLWFGDDPNHFKKWHRFSKDFMNFRREFIGTGSKAAKKGNFNSKMGEQIVDQLLKIDRPLAIDVANYFLDMKKVFSEMYRLLKNGGKACIIIGDTALCGVEILNSQVAIEQMQAAGFGKVNFIKRETHNKLITPWRDLKTGKFTGKSNPSKTRAYEYEYILIMEKSK